MTETLTRNQNSDGCDMTGGSFHIFGGPVSKATISDINYPGFAPDLVAPWLLSPVSDEWLGMSPLGSKRALPVSYLDETGVSMKIEAETFDSFPPVAQRTGVIPLPISANWQDLATSGLSETTYNHLLGLASLERGWNGAGSRGMNASSLAKFLKFWRKVRSLSADPELVLTPRGNLQAEWSKDQRHHLEIDFSDENRSVFFGLFDGPKTVIEGAASLDEVLQIVKSHRSGAALRWHFDGE